MIGTTVFYLQLATGQRSRDAERSCLDAIGNARVLRFAECIDTFNLDRLGSGAVDARAHFVQQVGQIDDLRFTRRVAQRRRAAAGAENRGRRARLLSQAARACPADARPLR